MRLTGRIFAQGKEYTVQVSEGMTVLEAIKQSGILFSAPCGGNGTCGKCRVTVKGFLSEPEENEKRFLTDKEIADGIRLACMCRVCGNFEVFLDNEDIRIVTEYRSASLEISPMVTRKQTTDGAAFYQNDCLIDVAFGDAANLGLAVDIGTTTVAAYLCDMETGSVLATRAFRNPQASYGADVISRIDKIMKDKQALFEQQKLISDAVRGACAEACHTLG